MRLKEDTSSYKSSNIKRRMYRQSPVDFRGKYKSKKDTNRWCKGKVGREHQFKEVEEYSFSIFLWSVLKCTNCNKKVNTSRKYLGSKSRL